MTKLWEPYDIPIVCITGEPGCGKTMWGLMVDPACLSWNDPPSTYIWDTEGSSTPYVGALNFERVDIPKLLFTRKSGKYSPEDTFTFWRDDLVQLEPNKYRVLILDTVTEIEDGLTSYISNNPTEFGYTANQFAKMEGLMWGVMKTEWKRLLMLASQKCETLVVTAHMKDVWKGKVNTNRRTIRGKETLIQVASIYMTLTRNVVPNAKDLSIKPSGICMWPGGKSRLVRINPETGQPEQLLPPHILDASPNGIRQYLKTPPNFAKLKPVERAVPPANLSDDDKLMIQAGIVSDELERARMEKESKVNVKQEKGSDEALKESLLNRVSLSQAKLILKERYNVEKIYQLTIAQCADLKKYIESLGK